MNWFERLIPPKIKVRSAINKRSVPQGLWHKCGACNAVLYGSELERTSQVCPKCGHHMRLNARERLRTLFDEAKFTELASSLRPVDPLGSGILKGIKKGSVMPRRAVGSPRR